MNCRDIEKQGLLTELALGERSGEEAGELLAHVAECEVCRASLARLRRPVELLGMLSRLSGPDGVATLEVPPDLASESTSPTIAKAPEKPPQELPQALPRGLEARLLAIPRRATEHMEKKTSRTPTQVAPAAEVKMEEASSTADETTPGRDETTSGRVNEPLGKVIPFPLRLVRQPWQVLVPVFGAMAAGILLVVSPRLFTDPLVEKGRESPVDTKQLKDVALFDLQLEQENATGALDELRLVTLPTGERVTPVQAGRPVQIVIPNLEKELDQEPWYWMVGTISSTGDFNVLAASETPQVLPLRQGSRRTFLLPERVTLNAPASESSQQQQLVVLLTSTPLTKDEVAQAARTREETPGWHAFPLLSLPSLEKVDGTEGTLNIRLEAEDR